MTLYTGLSAEGGWSRSDGEIKVLQPTYLVGEVGDPPSTSTTQPLLSIQKFLLQKHTAKLFFSKTATNYVTKG